MFAIGLCRLQLFGYFLSDFIIILLLYVSLTSFRIGSCTDSMIDLISVKLSSFQQISALISGMNS